MEHKHRHGSGHVGDIKVAFFLNLAFTVFELIGGLWTNSLAIISDSLMKSIAIDDVRATHHTHVWSLDGEHHVLSTHLIVADDTTKEQVLNIKRRARELIEDDNFEHVTLEIEYKNEDCTMEGVS